ncbi:MAG: SAM-dependent chlorinase/fluorinase [Microgenomates group bacterium]|nr:SAM-dependent chlorinase/fluorinase [Microgenomates group bacterium]
MRKLIVVADWSADSLSCQEFKISFEGFLKDDRGLNLSFVESTPSTIHTAFLLAQVVETTERYGKPLETVIFQNTDPRIGMKKGEFLVIKLKSGIYLAGPNAGYDFSLIKEKIDEAFVYQGLQSNSQFRSRDLFSRVCAHLIEEMEDELELEEIHLNLIPELKGFYIGHIDNFGNIKTTIKHEDLKGRYEYKDQIKIKINQVEKKAWYVDHLFAGEPGELVIYPGSSGVKDNPFIEIAVWKEFISEAKNFFSASQVFHYPLPGMKVEIF